jgi:hypothetical protein
VTTFELFIAYHRQTNHFFRGAIMMKKITLLSYTFLFQAIFSFAAISQGKAVFGIDAGIGEWRRMSLKEAGYILHYQYPIGYTVGFSVENPLFDHFSLVNELRYQKSTTTVTVDPGGYSEINEKVVMKQVVVPVLMKYQAPWLGDSYFLLGPSVGYLINAHYEYVIDPDGPLYARSAEITKDLPAIQTALEFGVGKGIQISGAELKLELRGEWGFTNFRYKRIDYRDPPDIGSWKNAGLQFVIGYKLN